MVDGTMVEVQIACVGLGVVACCFKRLVRCPAAGTVHKYCTVPTPGLPVVTYYYNFIPLFIVLYCSVKIITVLGGYLPLFSWSSTTNKTNK